MNLDDWRRGWFDYRRRRFWAWVAVVLYALVGFVLAPWLARGLIVDALEGSLDVTATLEDVDANPFFLSARLEGFSLAEPSGRTLVEFDTLEADFQSSSLFRRAYTFSELSVVNPFVEVVRTAQGFNLRRLMPTSEAAAGEPTSDENPLRLIVSRLEISGGRLDFEDQTTPETYRTELGPIEIIVHDLNTLPDREGRQQISVIGESGARLDWSGTITVKPLNSSGTTRLTGLPLRRLSAYVPASIAAAVEDGTGGFSFNYSGKVQADGSLAATVENLTVDLDRILIVRRSADEPPAPIFELAGMRLTGGTFAWPARSVSIARVEFDQPTASLSRDADGRFTWETVFADTGASDASAEAAAAADTGASDASAEAAAAADAGTVDASGESLDDAAAGTADASSEVVTAPPEARAPRETATPWQVSLAEFAVTDGAVRFDDATLTPAAQFGIEQLALRVESMTLAEDARMPFTLNFAVASGGAVAAKGAFALLPDLELKANIAVEDLALAAIQPYLEPSTWLAVRSGTLAIEGEIASTTAEALSFEGSTTVENLSVVHSKNDVRIAEWKTFSTAGVRIGATARQAEFATVALEDAYARIHINESGELNVAALLREPDSASADAATAAALADASDAPASAAAAAPASEDATTTAPWAVKVTRFDLKRSGTDFSDDSLPIPFRTEITDLNGRLTALDTTSRKAADIEFEGKVGQYGQVRLDGALQPLDIGRDTAFTARFSNIDLRDATPYAIRFAGHRIESGKLDLDTHYEVRERTLNAQHDIVLRDFALGERVESPDALDLPLNLAISLLKGPDGTISVELPIEGNVDDPKFRIGGIIRQAIVNLITKIITAPFRLLGLLVGMGEEAAIDRVVFEAGQGDLAPPEQEKIVKLAQALALRPQLQLGVPAAAAPAEDGLALREMRVRSRIDTAATGADQSQLRAVVEGFAASVVAVEEREALIAEFTTQTAAGEAPALDEVAYIDALTERLVAAEPVDPAALETLALARRDAVVAALLAQPGIEASRIARNEFTEVKPEEGEIPLVFTVDAAPSAPQAE